ncbi:Hypothetical protein Minf_0038 [Methylacidiphilum infernorum V4]|uniref:Uncharacterized protein n=1 Tax=Methylacidiphilum infernorum (isolate V4) TaxID=481448 RepID=B3DWK3_METI4|nr:Hypothetical protein Minf_0038 [Methylacidiphilum infernorum V4]
MDDLVYLICCHICFNDPIKLRIKKEDFSLSFILFSKDFFVCLSFFCLF